MPRGTPINVDGLHKRFYRKADRVGRIRIIQKDLAVELKLAPETVCRVLSRMKKDGRLRKLRSEKNNVGVYAVTDPVVWAAERAAAQAEAATE